MQGRVDVEMYMAPIAKITGNLNTTKPMHPEELRLTITNIYNAAYRQIQKALDGEEP